MRKRPNGMRIFYRTESAENTECTCQTRGFEHDAKENACAARLTPEAHRRKTRRLDGVVWLRGDKRPQNPGLGNELHYYRDDRGLEVDAIVERQGQWAGIEIKLSDTKVDDGAASLIALRNKMLANPAARHAEPAFMAVVVGRGSIAYTRRDDVLVIPAALLGA